MLKRLQAKIIGITMTSLVTMLIAILGLILGFTRQDLMDQNLQMMQELAEGPIQSLAVGSGSYARPFFIIEVSSDSEMTFIGSDLFDLSDEGVVQHLLEVTLTDDSTTGYIWEYGLRYYRSITPDYERVIFTDVSASLQTMHGLWRVCVIIFLLGVALFALLSHLLSRWAIRPVAQAWQQQRQFVADASHELKTPLTAIITNAELLQSTCPATPEQSRYTESIVTVSQKMRQLVERLLMLARVDNGIGKTKLEKVDFSAVTEASILPLEAVFFERNLLLESTIVPGISVKGSEFHLREVVEILLDNAQKYAEGSREIRLELKKTARNQCRLTVSNAGPALTPEQMAQIFERFYRVDESRGMTRSYGLGLPIAKGIVQEHHGRIWAECKDGLVLFHVTLPTVS